MKEAHEQTLTLMNQINAICVARGWTYLDLATALNEFLSPELKFLDPTPARIKIDRWRATDANRWSRPSGDYLIALQKVREKYK